MQPNHSRTHVSRTCTFNRYAVQLSTRLSQDLIVLLKTRYSCMATVIMNLQDRDLRRIIVCATGLALVVVLEMIRRKRRIERRRAWENAVGKNGSILLLSFVENTSACLIVRPIYDISNARSQVSYKWTHQALIAPPKAPPVNRCPPSCLPPLSPPILPRIPPRPLPRPPRPP